MRAAARQPACWHEHVNAVNPPAELRPWLTDCASLTSKLVARSDQFRVRPLRQQRGLCLSEECRVVGLPRRRKVWERDVLLQCDGRAVVFAHTIVPLSASTSDWPFFRTLGTRSLGSALFSDPLIKRGHLQFARLPLRHALRKRISMALEQEILETHLYARRCLYRRRRGRLLVTEVFLPALTDLSEGERNYPSARHCRIKRRSGMQRQ